MISPSITELMQKTDCRYTLVVAVAKRARQLGDQPEYLNSLGKKPVAVAVEELMAGDITFENVPK